ncbi:MAG: ABC transporter substrate-binding protein, partial [Aquincola sp.]|nr:ABC transporter substrate-binding protein [Aquincola sp.]
MNIRIVWRGVALALALLVGTLPAAAEDTAAASGGERKVLHVAFRSAETGFDPSMISDLYSRTVTPHIFEALYGYDHLARPAKFRPVTAIGMPEVSADFKTWTIRIQPGIFFADDPAFKGKRREMVARDYVYAFQRIADPINKSQLWSWVETFGLVGLNEYRSEVIADKKRFDYDRPIEGVRAIDRHTIQFKLKESRPRFLSSIAGSDLLGAQAREVVEFYGDTVAEHPVGTGPFRLKQWRRSSLIVLERNPDYRDVRYDAEPAADDAEGQ